MEKAAILEEMHRCVKYEGYSLLELSEKYVDDEDVKRLLPQLQFTMQQTIVLSEFIYKAIGLN